MDQIFSKIKKILEKNKYCPGHNFDHVLRVYKFCLKLAESENVDFEVLQAAALLHDIGGGREIDDPSGKTDHAVVGAEMAKPILKNLGFSKEKIQHIQDCIISHRYKNNNKPKTLEAKILFDADKLDAIGAIGVAREFVWVGRNNANIYKKTNINRYIKNNTRGGIEGRIRDKTLHSPQIEFEVKVKFLTKNLHTKKARKIAKERFKFHKDFLARLEKEINGEL